METKSKEEHVLHDLSELDPVELGVADSLDTWGQKAAAAGTALWDASVTTYERLADQAVVSAKATDRAIRDNPYQSVGIALGAGFLLGLLMKRR